MSDRKDSDGDSDMPTTERVLDLFVEHLKSEHKWTEKQVESMLKAGKEAEPTIPLSLFSESSLSAFELIVRHLHDNLLLSYSEIARLTSRDPRTVWTAHKSSMTKHPQPIEPKPSEFSFPVSILADRKLSVLESVVNHLHEHYGLPYSRIAALLHRDPRTVYTVKRRILTKLKNG
jgi:DNA-binding CsgD family transcriptional regulator